MTESGMTRRVEADRLMVIIPDRLSDLIAKGEVTERYYNPGGLFREVHIVMVNDDEPDPRSLQKMVGEANLRIHNIPLGSRFFLRTLGWRPWIMRRWAAKAVALARQIQPQLVRCHGATQNAFAASEIKRKLGIPYTVSLHTNPDQHPGISIAERIKRLFVDEMARASLGDADFVLPVYESIRPYLNRLGIKRIELAYNVVNPSNIVRKSDYGLHGPVRVISVGRQLTGKNPEHLIQAAAHLQRVHLTLVGDGPLHDHLLAIADRLGVRGRITFIKSLPNDKLCQQLAEHDILAIHTEYWEIPKTILEGMLAGLPVIINRPDPRYVPEITPNIALLVDNSPEGYRQGLEHLISDDKKRESLGRQAAQYASDRWDPEKTEARYAQIYRTSLGSRVRHAAN
jgi:glycosyltransferase involved in cell wall biosynthesis